MKSKIFIFPFVVAMILITAFCVRETQSEEEEEVVRPLGDHLTEIPRDWIETNFAFPGGKWKALIMSYDDGLIEDRRLVELMNTYGVRGTFHLNSGKFDSVQYWNGTCEYISSNEVVSLYEGHEVSCHGVTHANLSKSSLRYIYYELVRDRENLEAITGTPVRGMSYANGIYNNNIFDVILTNGIEYGRTTAQMKSFHLPKKFHIWKFTCHHEKATNLLPEFLSQPDGQMALFSIWGHSWEFEKNNIENNNWEYIETFLSNVGGRDDVWYATMIEVVDYVNAVMTVEFLEDGSVANPSAMEVWVKRGDTAVLIPAGGVWP